MSLRRSLYEISCAGSLEEFPWQDLCKRPLGQISATDLYAMSLYKISKRGVLARSLYRISRRGLLTRLLKRSFYKRSPQKISVGDLKVRSLFKISKNDLWARSLLSSPGLWTRSLRGLLARSLYKISARGLFARTLNKISIRGLLARSLSKLPLGDWQDFWLRCLVVCDPQSKCTWTCHQSNFARKSTGKMAGTPPETPFCASLRSRHAHGHFTRAILFGNLQGKCQRQQVPPRLNAGP